MKVSIIIPVYNCEKYIEACISSVLKITAYDWELILVDDGSKDSSGDICESFANKDSRISVYHQKNSGPSAARNFGLTKASGEYVRFVDSDDEVLTGECLQDESADLVIMNAQLLNEKREVLREINIGTSRLCLPHDLISSMDRKNKAAYLHYIWNKMYKLDIINKFALKFDETLKLGEDFVFNCQYMERCNKVLLSEEKSYYYFYHDSASLTQKFFSNELERRRIMDSTLMKLYSSVGLDDEHNIKQIHCFMGEVAFGSIQSVSKPDCKIVFREKVKFLSGFINSEYRSCMIEYAKASEHLKIGQRIQVFLLKLRWSTGLALYLGLHSKIIGWKR